MQEGKKYTFHAHPLKDGGYYISVKVTEVPIVGGNSKVVTSQKTSMAQPLDGRVLEELTKPDGDLLKTIRTET
ncbi:MAG: hypothetical protein V4723_17730 [Pseudomonadota bacterium]